MLSNGVLSVNEHCRHPDCCLNGWPLPARAPEPARHRPIGSPRPAHRVFNSLSFLVFLAVCFGLLSFEDSPPRARFECPDGSHLDSRSAPGFNRLLGEELSRQLPGALAAPLP